MSDFVIGIGANLGPREDTLVSATNAVGVLAGVELRALSAVYESDAIGPPQPAFLNAALRIECALSADALFERLLAIEVAHGRVRLLRWGPRTLDLDILWSDQAVTSDALVVPHAALHERTFALAPLLDVAPELAPVYAQRLAALGGAPPRRGWLTRSRAPTHGAVAFTRAL